jgi:hypothetical protein
VTTLLNPFRLAVSGPAANTLANTFEGGTDGVTISTANSGGGSGDAFDAVTGAATIVYDDDAPAPLIGTMSCHIAATTGQTGILDWTASWQTSTEVWRRIYIYKTNNPTNSTVIMSLLNGAALGCDVRVTSTGTIQFRDGNQVARATSTALANDSLHRIEWRILHSTTVGRIEGRIFSGANAQGSTPDQTLGSPSTNRDTATQSTRTFTGVISNPGAAGLDIYYDNVAITDGDWLGS